MVKKRTEDNGRLGLDGDGSATALVDPSNSASDFVKISEPYQVRVTIRGTSSIIFHRWNIEAIDEKAALSKGSKGKKQDNVESYLYRIPDGEKGAGNIAIPGAYLLAALRDTAKFFQDPRSPRASFQKLLPACLVPLTEYADTGKKAPDFIDKRRVTVMRAGLTRHRPALMKGWEATFEFDVVLPEYLPREKLLELLNMCGRVNGLADFRPTYGRFHVTEFKVIAPK